MNVGDKVICVDDSILSNRKIFVAVNYPMWVKLNHVYTIREILNNDDIVPGVLLEELVNPSIHIKLLNRFQEPAFRLDRFRKIEDDEQIGECVEESIEELLKLTI